MDFKWRSNVEPARNDEQRITARDVRRMQKAS